jgi:hypothetical protein
MLSDDIFKAFGVKFPSSKPNRPTLHTLSEYDQYHEGWSYYTPGGTLKCKPYSSDPGDPDPLGD